MIQQSRANPKRWPTRWLLALAALSFNILMSCATGPNETPLGQFISVPGATIIDNADCAACHDEQATSLVSTRHGKKNDPRTPAGTDLCQSCHGPGSVHAKNREDGKEGLNDIIRFSKGTSFPAAQLSQQCLSCHEKMTKQRFHTTGHAAQDVTCANCHSVHSPKGEPQLKLASEVETCAQCHKDIRAQIERPSHHPIREGKISCSNCHDPHGSGYDKNLRKSNVNDTCYQCHQEKRGPMLHEHPPVFENCANCHTPHGSNNSRLLVSDPPKLCQMCHVGSGHFAGVYDKATTLEGGGSPFRLSAVGARSVDRGCIDCHTRIHGSNHPSGRFFNR